MGFFWLINFWCRNTYFISYFINHSQIIFMKHKSSKWGHRYYHEIYIHKCFHLWIGWIKYSRHTLSDTFSLSDTRFQRKLKFSWFKPFYDVNYGRFPICFVKKSLNSWIGSIAIKINNLNIIIWNFHLMTHFFRPKLCHSGYFYWKFNAIFPLVTPVWAEKCDTKGKLH